MAGRDSFQGCLEVGEGLDAIDLCSGDKGCDACPGSAALVMAGEEHILARRGDRPCVDAPFLASVIFDLSAGSSIGPVSGL